MEISTMRIGLYDNKQSAKDRSHVHDEYHGFSKMGCCGIFVCAGIPLEASVDDSLLLMEELWRRALAAGKLAVS
jgi:hypothetical protein